MTTSSLAAAGQPMDPRITGRAHIAHVCGTALVQVKERQLELLYACGTRTVQEPMLDRLTETEKLLGRLAITTGLIASSDRLGVRLHAASRDTRTSGMNRPRRKAGAGSLDTLCKL